jgi:hypothetical protein
MVYLTISNVFACFFNRQRRQLSPVLFNESAYLIGVSLAVFPQAPADCFIDEKFALSEIADKYLLK